jgi:Dolichyl-phosphate-mannose-protein mannosyltransferase
MVPLFQGTRPMTTLGSMDRAPESHCSLTSRPTIVEKPRHESGPGWFILACVWVGCALYMWTYLRQGWIPYDSGALAQMAERTLNGQVPHRDFIEVYTGGLTYLNAFAFRLFGVNLFSLRIPLFLFFVGWVPSVYFIARRFATPLVAGVCTFLAVAWSVPNYPEAMPSWYNLFFATWGILALLSYAESTHSIWLWSAGFCGGLSFLVKISGLYFVAAALLFLIFREQTINRAAVDNPLHMSLSYRLFVTAGLGIFVLSLLMMISTRPTAFDVVNFVLPSTSLAAFLFWRLWRQPSSRSAERFINLAEMGAPFLGGILIPILPFLLWYAREDALRDWFTGVFISPLMRMHWQAFDPISLIALTGLIPTLLIVIVASDPHDSIHRMASYGSPLLLVGLLFLSWKSLIAYTFIAYSLPLLVVLLGLFAPLVFHHAKDGLEPKCQQAFLIVAAAVTWALVQFPYSSIGYFCYVAPLLIIALLALLVMLRRVNGVATGALILFYLLFAVWLHPPAYFINLGVPLRHPAPMRQIPLKRAGGIRAPERIAREYGDVIQIIRDHARGPYIFAAPDMPEVYFLSGAHNATRTIYDFLDPGYLDPLGREQRILAVLSTYKINAIVLAHSPLPSGIIGPGLRRTLDASFPRSMVVGDMEVRWK